MSSTAKASRLDFFFNRKSPWIKLLNLIGLSFSLYFLIELKAEYEVRGLFTVIGYDAFVLLSWVLLIFTLIPFYKKEDRGFGIEEHFQKTLVPVAYMINLIHLSLLFMTRPWFLILFCALFLLVVVGVNIILTSLHLMNDDTYAPAYFSRSLYLKK